MSGAVIVPSLMMMTLIVSEESLATHTHTHTHTHTERLGTSMLTFAKSKHERMSVARLTAKEMEIGVKLSETHVLCSWMWKV